MLPFGPRVRALFLVAVLVGASALLLGGQGFGFSAGIDEELEAGGGGQGTLREAGCNCHNVAYTGTVKATLDGVPAFWAFQDKVETGPFNLTIRISGGPPPSATGAQGGFNLQSSAGTFSVPEGKTDVQVMDSGEATHTAAGNKQREWQVLWTPPTAAGPDALFTLTVNSVDGNGAPVAPDAWGRATVIAMGTSRAAGAGPGAAEGEPVTSLGVNFYAYWVGVISFIVLFVVLAATFFLLRYGETTHWTDWKDRPARDKGEAAAKGSLGTWVVLGVVLVVFAVAAVQVLRLV